MSFNELAQLCAVPGEIERHSPLLDHPLLVLDLESDFPVDADVPLLAAALAGLPCPSIGVGEQTDHLPQQVLAAVDVLVAKEQDLAALSGNIQAHPLAAATLVQVLRHNAGASVSQGLLAESLAFEERAIALQPDALQPNVLKARDLSELGRHDEAVTLLRRLPVDVMTTLSLGVFVKAGLRAEAEQRFALVPVGSRFRFIGLAHLGRYEDALAALDPATVPVNMMQDVLFEPYLDPIRSDPRFVKVLATLGMTEAHARAQAWRKAHPPEKAAK